MAAAAAAMVMIILTYILQMLLPAEAYSVKPGLQAGANRDVARQSIPSRKRISTPPVQRNSAPIRSPGPR